MLRSSGTSWWDSFYQARGREEPSAHQLCSIELTQFAIYVFRWVWVVSPQSKLASLGIPVRVHAGELQGNVEEHNLGNNKIPVIAFSHPACGLLGAPLSS